MKTLNTVERAQCVHDAHERRVERERIEQERIKNAEQGLADTTTVVVPCRIVGMRMLSNQGYETVERTILPPMKVTMPKTKEGKTTNVNQIRYLLNTPANTGLPIAHIFSNGFVCYGTIPLPRVVSAVKCLSPLDTLLGYNDRNTSHGGARFVPTRMQKSQIDALANHVGLTVELNPNHNWITSDGPWRFCRDLLRKYDAPKAIQYAEQLFNIMWGTPMQNVQEGQGTIECEHSQNNQM